MAQLENRAQEFWYNLIDSETIKNGVDLATGFLEVVTNIVDATNGLAAVGVAGGALAAFLGKDKLKQ